MNGRNYLLRLAPLLSSNETRSSFVQDEITSLVSRRSAFEHKVNARGSQSSDWARYAEFEINIESLRRKRAKRLGVKNGGYSGHRRILLVLERATRKFHGDVDLWMQYIETARKFKANRKVNQILTDILRLHPTKPDLWIYAANFAIDGGDISTARGYMQQGLRFCKRSKKLWLEYARLEMFYVAKIIARRRVLGFEEDRPESLGVSRDHDPDANMVTLPTITAKDVNPNSDYILSAQQAERQKLDKLPALSGAISIAIFDAAMKEFQADAQLGEGFFEIFASFEEIPNLGTILQHVASSLMTSKPKSPMSFACYIRQPLIGVAVTSLEFPDALATVLKRLDTTPTMVQPRVALTKKMIYWILSYIDKEGLDANIRSIFLITLRQLVSEYQMEIEQKTEENGDDFWELLDRLHSAGLQKLMYPLNGWALNVRSSNPRLLAMRENLIQTTSAS